MDYIIAVFSSRHATFRFANLLRAQGIPAAIINTPGTISKVCGISVKFLFDYKSAAQKLLGSLQNPSFMGFYHFNPSRKILERI